MLSESDVHLDERPWTGRIAFVLALSYSLGVLAWFHDRSWWPPDEGVYAHLADRILDGEVLNRDVQNVHPGYIVFTNAAALGLFGKDLLSLRYPIAAVTFLAAVMMYLIGAKRNVLSGFVSSVCVSSLSVVQFLNPTAHWYCFFLFALTLGVLFWLPKDVRGRVELVGFLVATIFLFRQLTGVLAAIGVVTYLLLELQPEQRKSLPWISRGLFLVMFAGLAGYLAMTVDRFSFISIGLWPLAILLIGMARTNVTNRDTVRLALRLVCSAIVAFLPLLSYHAWYGSLGFWVEDTFVSAFRIANLDFISQPRYSYLFTEGAMRASALASFSETVNSLFWMILPVLPGVLGLQVVVALLKRNPAGAAPLPLLAVFFSIVSLHLQIPIYLFYTISFTAAGLLWMNAGSREVHSVVAALLLCLSAVGTLYHAGQPFLKYEAGGLRTRDVMAGERFDLVPAELTRATLKIERSDRELYHWLLGLIENETSPGDAIFALPMNAELYFLSGRRNPCRIYCTSIGIESEHNLDTTLAELQKTPPTLVFFRSDDKYNSNVSRRIMQWIRGQYLLLETRFGFEVYQKSESRPPSVVSAEHTKKSSAPIVNSLRSHIPRNAGQEHHHQFTKL